jgi:DNA-binding NarL/FixJ family response regulator
VRTIRVLIVDDHVLFAEVLRHSIEARGIEVVGCASTAAEALGMTRRSRPDVVLVDIGLPDRSGLALGRDILDLRPNVKTVAVTALNDPIVKREAIRAGFSGFISKDVEMSGFVDAVTAAVEKRDGFVDADGPRAASRRIHDRLIGSLTRRERDVLELLAVGASSQAIARRLSISANTVRTHVQSILTKLQLHSRLEAAAFAIRHGIPKGADQRDAS